MQKISVQIVTFNSKIFLKDCLNSLFAQTFKDFSVLIIDNCSKDDSLEFIEKNYAKQKANKKLFVMQNSKNLGFSKAHNLGIKITNSEFVLVMNPDIILSSNFLKEIIKYIDKKKRIGCVGGKLLKIINKDREIGIKEKTNIIDSTGIAIIKSTRAFDRGEGQIDKKQYDKENNIFGVSGACALYRRKALEDIKMPVMTAEIGDNYEYFDEDFFAYKEDVDLAWRIKLRKWRTIYCPQAIAYHFRAGAPSGKKFSQSKFVNYLSFRNHLWFLIKNIHLSNFFIQFHRIFLYISIKGIYLFYLQPKVLIKSNSSFFKGIIKMYKKRRYILKNARLNAQQIKIWFQ
ncbi:glycosyltransferase family 2 protein [Patescibacteria group bacterium]|nr:glycosyltransferase family 2 protein [Patescibacteria group bacterium]